MIPIVLVQILTRLHKKFQENELTNNGTIVLSKRLRYASKNQHFFNNNKYKIFSLLYITLMEKKIERYIIIKS